MEDRKLEVFDVSELKERLCKLKEKEAIVIRWFSHATVNHIFSELNEYDEKYSVIVDEHIREFAKTYCHLTLYSKDHIVPKSTVAISLNMYNPDTVPSDIDMNKVNTIIDVVIFDNDMQISNQKTQIGVTQRDCINSYKLTLNIYPGDVQGSSLLDLFDTVFEKMDAILKNDYANYLMGF